MDVQVPAGSKEPRPANSSLTFINTPSHSQLLADMMQSHMVKDLCLIGAKVENTHTHTLTHTPGETNSDISTAGLFCRDVGSQW